MSFYEVAKQSAILAGEIIRKGFFKKDHDIDYKGEINLVTETDIMAEKTIINELRRNFPTHGILTEESSEKYQESDYVWIIDPLDGTTNFTHKYPHVAVSIALSYKGEVVLGIVFNPILNEFYSSEKGAGAFKNDKKISVSGISELDKSFLGTGFPYDRRKFGDKYMEEYREFLVRSQGIRRDGAAALDLCYVAEGIFDGFWERKLQPWDVAAGSLILIEAGGKITKFNGGSWRVDHREILATNSLIHNEMVNITSKFKL